jgi:hypothetical protein
MGVMPSLAQKRTVFSELANGWNNGGCGFCKGFGTTPTDVRMPSFTPLPHFAVVSSVHGVGPAGTFQYLPSKVSISSVQHFLTMRKFSSKASRLALSISSCWLGSAPWMPCVCCAMTSTQRRW